MPKTLAALPNNQYPTDLRVVSGKNALLAGEVRDLRGIFPGSDAFGTPVAIAVASPRATDALVALVSKFLAFRGPRVDVDVCTAKA